MSGASRAGIARREIVGGRLTNGRRGLERERGPAGRPIIIVFRLRHRGGSGPTEEGNSIGTPVTRVRGARTGAAGRAPGTLADCNYRADRVASNPPAGVEPFNYDAVSPAYNLQYPSARSRAVIILPTFDPAGLFVIFFFSRFLFFLYARISPVTGRPSFYLSKPR